MRLYGTVGLIVSAVKFVFFKIYNMLLLYFQIFPLCIALCTTLIKFFNILVVIELLIKIFYHLAE